MWLHALVLAQAAPLRAEAVQAWPL